MHVEYIQGSKQSGLDGADQRIARANGRLLLYLNGWAMSKATIEHLSLPADTDLMICQDYRDIDFHPPLPLDKYEHITLVAWSMGVWAAEYLAATNQLPQIDDAVAWAGTSLPMDDRYGIPDVVFRATLASLDEPNRALFNRRMCGGKSLQHLFEALQERATEEIRAELLAVYHRVIKSRRANGDNTPRVILPWSKAYVPRRDKIIPATNQRHHWQDCGIDYIELPMAEHYMMQHYSRWDDLL